MSDFGLKLEVGISSTKSFNSFSKLLRSFKSISLVGFLLSLIFPFISNSKPPPKLELLLELPKLSSSKFNSVISIISAIVSINLLDHLFLSNTNAK